MDWCGIVGEVDEIFRNEWIAGFHWKVHKITSMPDRMNAVYFSPPFRFLDVKWYLGIYRNCRLPDKVWIGLEICRSKDQPPKPVRFSIGVMHADQIEHLIHSNQNYPAVTNNCCINEFLPVSALSECKDKIAPLDVLTVTCVMWPDICVAEKLNSLSYRELKLDSEGTEDAKDRDRVSFGTKIKDWLRETAGDESVKTMTGNRNKPTSASVEPEKNDGIVREVSKGVEWEVHLPPPMTPWAFLSPVFTCGEIKYHFNLHPDELNSDCICVRFIASISGKANFPLPIRWRMAVKRGDLNGFRWIMSGQMTVQEENHHSQEILIKRAELENLLSSGARLTFFHHLIVAEVDADKEVSLQTDFEEFQRLPKLSLQSPEEEDLICRNQQEKFEASLENLFSSLPRHDREPFMFAA